MEKSLQESLKSLKVSKSHVEFGILYKLLYINVLSFLLQFLLLIWYSGTVGHLGHLVLFSSLFLSLAISLRSTFAMPHVIVFAGFTGTELLSLP